MPNRYVSKTIEIVEKKLHYSYDSYDSTEYRDVSQIRGS